jgi:hypothetical protein
MSADPRLVFLHRAHARLILVEAGAMDIADAFAELIEPLLCGCSRDIVERWERDYPRHKPRRVA